MYSLQHKIYSNDKLKIICGSSDIYENTLIIAAHPDDEVIGASGRLPLLKNFSIIHSTDGAPENMMDAVSAGLSGMEEYSSARRQELYGALHLAGISEDRCRCLGFKDQGISFSLAEAAECIKGVLEELMPDIVLTHPYEGGHPDHDSTAFAVHAACRLIRKKGNMPPVIIEFTSYHGNEGSIITAEFLPYKNILSCSLILSEQEMTLKNKMLDCFVTQQKTLSAFRGNKESFRYAPGYDFSIPPHKGKLYYEYFNWGIDGAQWRSNALSALKVLGIQNNL